MASLASSVLPSTPVWSSANAVSSSEVDLRWNHTTNEDGYRIWHWTASSLVQVGRVGRDVTSFTVNGLQPASRQFFQVEAFNGVNAVVGAWQQILMPTVQQEVAFQYRVGDGRCRTSPKRLALGIATREPADMVIWATICEHR